MEKTGWQTKFLHPSINKEGNGDKSPLPKKRTKLFFFLLGTCFGKLVMLNLLTIQLSLPVLTIPASQSALLRVRMKLMLQGYCSVYA